MSVCSRIDYYAVCIPVTLLNLINYLALKIALKKLYLHTTFICKIFQGGDYKDFTDKVRALFAKQTAFRPKSTRKASREVFVIGLGKK